MEVYDSVEIDAPAHDWKYIVVHHSATVEGSVESLDAVHRQRRDQFGNAWLGIGYHFVIGNGRGMRDGQIDATFRWKEQTHGAHSRSRRHNRYGIGVCLIGNFDEASPTPRQMSALESLTEFLLSRFPIEKNNVVRHLDVAATRCPGRLFPFAQFVESITVPLVVSVPDENDD